MRIQGWLGRSDRARSGGKEDLRLARCAPRAASRLGRREEGGGKAGGRRREASPHALLGLFELSLWLFLSSFLSSRAFPSKQLANSGNSRLG